MGCCEGGEWVVGREVSGLVGGRWVGCCEGGEWVVGREVSGLVGGR